MKIKILYIALAMSMIFGSVGVVAAEPTLDQILTGAYGANHYTEVTSTSDYLLKPASYTSVTIYTKIDADQGAYDDPTGWYEPGAQPVLHGLFDKPRDGLTNSFTTGNQFGIYIHSDSFGNIYSENSKNPRKLVKLFDIDKNNNGKYDDNCYAFAFEDLITGSDNDYQDIVVEVSSNNQLTLVPEFPTVAVPVAAVLGLLFMFGRKKEKL
jgi:hypothetical protein